MANGSIAVQVDIKGLKPTQDLHAAVCNAVAMLNCCPEAARLTDVRRAHDTLRQALVELVACSSGATTKRWYDAWAVARAALAQSPAPEAK